MWFIFLLLSINKLLLLQHKKATWRGESRLWIRKQMVDFLLPFFTKFTQVVPLQSKNVPDVIQGMKACLKLMRKMPNLCNADKCKMRRCNTRIRIIVFPLLFLVLWLSSQASRQNATMLQEMACQELCMACPKIWHFPNTFERACPESGLVLWSYKGLSKYPLQCRCGPIAVQITFKPT
jgi:hypothetical protein